MRNKCLLGLGLVFVISLTSMVAFAFSFTGTPADEVNETEMIVRAVVSEEADAMPTTEPITTTGQEQEMVKNEQSKIGSMDWDSDDAYRLAKIAMAEAESEDTEGKALVMLVVLNRVWDDEFPDTIEEVIFQKGQFSPISNGRYDEVEPDEDCYRALQLIQTGGWDESHGATYFESKSDSTWHSENLTFLFKHMVSKTAYTEITLVAEVAKYFPDIRCTEVARILRESEEGIDKILVAVNEHNDIIYDKIVPTIFEALYRVNKEIVKENVDVKLLKKPKEGGYYEFSGNEDLIIMQNSEDSVVVKNKDKSFHADTYVFDSKPELQLFLQLLANEHVKKAYFTGMFTADQTDFYVPYIDPESNRLRKYYPDFLVKMDDGSYLILEVKGDNMIDDPVVKAKGAAAEEVAVESSMKYEMLKGTDIMEGKAKI